MLNRIMITPPQEQEIHSLYALYSWFAQYEYLGWSCPKRHEASRSAEVRACPLSQLQIKTSNAIEKQGTHVSKHPVQKWGKMMVSRANLGKTYMPPGCTKPAINVLSYDCNMAMTSLSFLRFYKFALLFGNLRLVGRLSAHGIGSTFVSDGTTLAWLSDLCYSDHKALQGTGTRIGWHSALHACARYQALGTNIRA